MLNTPFLIKTNEYVLDNRIKQNETLPIGDADRFRVYYTLRTWMRKWNGIQG